jgi:hypothetical protein
VFSTRTEKLRVLGFPDEMTRSSPQFQRWLRDVHGRVRPSTVKVRGRGSAMTVTLVWRVPKGQDFDLKRYQANVPAVPGVNR